MIPQAALDTSLLINMVGFGFIIFICLLILVARRIIKILTFLEIIPLKLCLQQWVWLLHKLGKI